MPQSEHEHDHETVELTELGKAQADQDNLVSFEVSAIGNKSVEEFFHDNADAVSAKLKDQGIEVDRQALQSIAQARASQRTVLHKPPATVTLGTVLGFAVDDSGQICALNGLNEKGEQIVVQMRTELVGMAMQCLINARNAAVYNGADGNNSKVAIRTPNTWEIFVATDFAGVVMVFDKGDTLNQTVLGFDAKAAREMGKALVAMAQKASSFHRPKIIKPGDLN